MFSETGMVTVGEKVERLGSSLGCRMGQSKLMNVEGEEEGKHMSTSKVSVNKCSG